MTTMGPIERVVLTHLRIPFKESFRISAGEVSVKDAILVAVETTSGIGVGESSPMAAGFGYSSDTPAGCWDDLTRQIAPACWVDPSPGQTRSPKLLRPGREAVSPWSVPKQLSGTCLASSVMRPSPSSWVRSNHVFHRGSSRASLSGSTRRLSS